MFACIYAKAADKSIALKEFAYSFSPLIEETTPDTVVLDIEGCELLFGSPYELAKEIAKRANTKQSGGLGCAVNVALANNPDTAIYAARFFNGISFISPGEELSSLGELPIEQLQLSPKSKNPEPFDIGPWADCQEIFETLKIWGARTFRDFAALPTAGISERFGQAGVKLQQLAGGKTQRQLKLTQTAPRFEGSIELEHSISQLEPLSFLLARLLNEICANLNAYALATNELRLSLKLEKEPVYERKLTLPYPMRDPRVFLRLLLLDAEMHPPQSAVLAVTIQCEPVKPRVLQSGLFIPLAPEPDKLELTLARLAKLVGINNVGSMELLDTHRPDAFRIKRFVINTTSGKKKIGLQRARTARLFTGEGKSTSFTGFRVFRPPLRALVNASQGCPLELSAWGAHRSVHGKVVQAAGPWRTTGDWWRLDRWARDEWDVAIENRAASSIHRGQTGLYRIYRELQEGTWFVEGMYD